MNGKSKKSKLRSFSEASKLHFLLGKKKPLNDQKKRKISLPLENSGRHAVARRSIRGRSSSNLTLEKDTQSPSISLPEIVSIKMSRQQSPLTRNKTSRNSKITSSSSIGGNLTNDQIESRSEDQENTGASEEKSIHEPNGLAAKLSNKMPMINGSKSTNISGNIANELKSTTETREDENKENSGIFTSLVSAAHNVASHLIRKTSQKDSIEEPSQNEQQDDTVMYKPLSAEHNPSFLQHLDFLLSAGPIPAPELLSPKSSSLSEQTNHLSLDPKSSAFPSATPSIIINSGESENGGLSPQETENMSLADKVKFQPLKGDSHITTFGKGNLTLDALGMKSEAEQPLEQGSPKSTPLDQFDFHVLNRKRGKTISASEMKSDAQRQSSSSDTNLSLSPVRTEPTRDKQINGVDSLSPKAKLQDGSRYAHSDEAGEARSRKRSDTKKFISRRSFSPTNVALKIIPSTGLRNSFQRIRSYSTGDDIYVDTGSISSDDEGGSLSYRDENKPNHVKLRNVSYAPEKKNNEFHTIFKDAGISSNEKLLSDFSCALSRDILLQGRMFISEKNICFNSSILGWITTVVIPFREIVQIEKKSTAGIFPNGIVFQTLHTKYIFASFLSRDSTFDYITSIWNQIILGVDSQRLHDDLSDTTESPDDNNADHGSEVDTRRKVISRGYSSDDYTDDEESSNSDMTTSDNFETNSITDDDYSRSNSSVHRGSSPSTISTIGPSKHPPTTANFLKDNTDRLITETVFDAPLGKVVNILYGNNVSLLREILEVQKNFDISEIPTIIASKERKYSYSKPISGTIGPSKTQCQITETLEHFDLEAYVKAVQISKTPDVPYGSSFYVKTSFFLSWAPKDCTKLTVLASVEWTGKSWVKGTVEKYSFDGIASSVEILIDEVNKFLHNSAKRTREDSEKSITDKGESLNLPSVGPTEHTPTEPDYQKEDGDVIIDESMVIPAPLGTTFQVLFGDDSSYFHRILEKQGNYDLSDIPKFNDNKREYQYTKPLSGPVGPKKTRCLIEENVEYADFNSYIVVRQITKTPDVPSGSSFSIHTKFYLSWGPNNSTKFLIVTNVMWTAKSWIKSAVEKGSIDGQKSSIGVLESELKDIVANAGSSKKKRGKKKLKIKVKKPRGSKKRTTDRMAPASGNQSFIGGVTTILTSIGEIVPQSIILITLGIFLAVIFFKLFTRSAQPSFELIKPGQIIINGNAYNYAPSLGTLYDVYEQEIRTGTKGKSNGNVVTNAESGIWDWIQDRGDILQKNSLSEPSKARLSVHGKQDLEETIRIAELQLNELKSQLSNS